MIKNLVTVLALILALNINIAHSQPGRSIIRTPRVRARVTPRVTPRVNPRVIRRVDPRIIRIAPARRIKVGKRRNVLPPIHLIPNLQLEKPVVHPMLNMYQLDQEFADLFGTGGASNICGASSMANALIYLKHNHTPKFPKILKDSIEPGDTNGDVVRLMFDMCDVNPNSGTTSKKLRDCAKDGLEEGDYNTSNTFVRGVHSSIKTQKFPPSPADLKVMITNRYDGPQDSITESDRAVVLLFGWYQSNWDNAKKKNVYSRVGGHFVTLSGYDGLTKNYHLNSTKKKYTFYVSNPLVDYNALHPTSLIRYSKLSLEAVPKSVELPAKFKQNKYQAWQTTNLVGGALAVLEDMVIVLPWEK